MSSFRLTALSRGWLTLENSDTPMHMGALLYLKLPARTRKTWVADLAAAWTESTEVASPWNLRLNRHGFATIASSWLPDDDVELDYHFRHSALPAPGGEREMGELISRLHGRALDLSRPPWECHLIEGLHGNRFALYFKVHAALISGPELVDAIMGGFGTHKGGSSRAPWTRPVSISFRSTQGAAWPSMLGPLRRRLRDAVFSTLPWAGLRRPPRSALNDHINSLRRFATQEYSRERLAAVGAAVNATEEDIICYLVGSAVRRFFREYNALPEAPMVALVADRSRVDGQLAPLLVSLGTQHASRRRRMREVRESLRVARGMVNARSKHAAAAESAVEVMPYILRQLAGIDHRLPPMFNLGIVRFAAGTDSRYLGTAQLESVFPMPMLLQGSALAVASLTYAGKISVGLCGARDNLPHLQRMAVYMETALAELEKKGLNDD